MQNFNGKVRQYLKENERKKRSRLFGVVLSVVMTVSVLASLVMPAISATEGTSVAGGDVSYNGGSYSYKDANSVTIKSYDAVGSGKDQSKKIEFNVEFNFDKGAMTNRYIYFPIDDNVSLPEGGIPSDGTWGDVEDTHFDEGHGISGKYRVDEIDGKKYLFIEFDERYQHKNEKDAISGKASFEGNVKRKDTDTGDKTTVEIGGQTVEIDGFTPLTMSAIKDASETADGVRWTITVDNPAKKPLDRIEDKLFKDAVDGSFTVSPEGAGSYDASSGKFVFSDGFSEENVTISYTTPYPTSDPNFVMSGKVENKSTTYDKDGNGVKADKTIYSESKKDKISKTGKNVDYDNNEVTWEIVVSNPSGADLKGYHLYDEAFPDAKPGSFALKADDGSDVKYTLNGNTLTFDDKTTASKITIEYVTAIDPDKAETTNTVKMQRPDKSQPWSDITSSETVYNRYQISKSGWIDNNTLGILKWEVTVKCNDKNSTLKGKTITDNMLKAGQIVSIKVGNDTFDATVASDGELVLPDRIGDNNEVVISYETKVADYDLGDPDSNGNYAVKNTAGIDGFHSDKTVYYKPVNEKSKTVLGISQDGSSVTYKWQVEVKQTNGSFRGKTISDIMNATSNDGKSIKSVLDTDSIIMYVQRNGTGSYEPLDSSNYTVVSNADNTSFEIKFNDSEEFDNINLVQIQYSSTVDVTGFDEGTIINVNNKATYKGETFEPSADKTKFTIGDSSKAPYEKYDAASSVAGDTVHDLSSLPVVTVNGVEYYRFDWRLDINKDGTYKRNDNVEIVDTLPAGMIFYENKDYLKYSFGNSSDKYDFAQTNQFEYFYDKTANTVTFKTAWNQQDAWTAYYSTLVKVDDVKNGVYKNGTAAFKNTVQDKAGKYPERSQTQTVKEKNLKKTSSPKSTGCEITYTIDVNPKKLKCSTNGMITLNDVIKCGGTAVVKTKDAQGNIQTKTVSINGNSAVDMDLKSIKVFDADTGAELAVSDYSYVISDPEAVDSTVSCSADVITNDKGKFIANFIPSESIVGAKGTIDLTLPEGYENGNIKSYYVAYGYMDGNSFKEVKAFANKRSEWSDFGSSISVPVEEVSSEKAGGVFRVEYEYRDGNGFSNTEVSNEKMLSAVKCSALTAKTQDFVKKLEINVPDQRHLKLVYVYTGSPANDEDAENDGYKVHVFNNISFDTNGSAVNDSEDNDSEFELINQSKASSTTVEPFKLMKVDSGDYSIMLKASFEIYRYTKLENGTYDWLPAVDFKENAAKDRNSVIWGSSAQDKAQTFNVNADGSYNLDLEPAAGTGDTEGHLYKLIEKQSPEGYLLDETPIYFAFKVRPAVVPSEVGEDGYQFVKNGDMFRVTNLLKEFKITASKVWSDGNGNHSAESVKFLLGSSTTKVLSGVPDDIQWGSAEVTLNEANNWKHEWTKLPGYTKVGNDYKQLYYYIKEIDLATGYEAVYSATAMSKNTDVTVTNVKGLNITKEWRDELGNKLADSELPAGIDKIEADVYESSVAPNSTTRVNGDNGIPTDCKLIKTVSLEKSKNWTVTLDGLDKDKYYYVLEKNIPDGFGVTYTYSNNGSATGFDTIVNTKNPQKVENMDVRLQKAWSDGDSNTHTNDKVTFNIYRSTNKADVPEKYNKFTGTMDKGQNVKFKILTSNGTEMAQNGSFASEYAMYGSAKFSFDMTKSWINIGETEGRVRVLDSSGAVLADIYKSGENWVDGKPIPMWSGDSKYVSVSDYVTPVPNKDATPSGEVFLWKQITLTADNNWSNAVSLEKNDIKGNKYYYWFEEIEVNGQPISTSSYKAYFRYNGSENENCIDMTKNGDQYVQVYNNSEETLGELPETGGMGVIPFVAAGGTVTVVATILLVTKRRKKTL